jgi:hypothetical protein
MKTNQARFIVEKLANPVTIDQAIELADKKYSKLFDRLAKEEPRKPKK